MRASKARVAMIDAAEQLIAEQGLAVLTLKAVQDAAGQSNKSAAQYHFGSRDGLIAAVVEARMAPVNRRRQEILDAWESEEIVPSVRQVVEALVVPLAAETLGREDSFYARFLAQALVDPGLAGILQKHLQAESSRQVQTLLVANTDVPAEVGRARAAEILSLVVSSLAMRERRARTSNDVTAFVADLIEICIAIVGAPGASTTSLAVAQVSELQGATS